MSGKPSHSTKRFDAATRAKIVELFHKHGLSHKQLSERFGCSRGVIVSTLHDAKIAKTASPPTQA